MELAAARLLWIRSLSGDSEKQAKLSLRSVVKTAERKGKLKYYVSKGTSVCLRVSIPPSALSGDSLPGCK